MKTLALMMALLLGSQGFGQSVSKAPPRAQVNKTMIKNFVKSLILPGWGQWSSGHKAKAAGFLLAEIGSIAGYQINFAAGDDETTAFKVYANEHWSYADWLDRNGWDVEDNACGNLRTHQMPTLLDHDGLELLDENSYPIPLRDHHYYENISKYPEFICGWDDIADYYAEDGKDYTPNKKIYIDMRTHSNEMYRRAQFAGTLIFVNHIVSALDAAIGTDITSFESTNYSGKFYINPLSTISSLKLEVKF